MTADIARACSVYCYGDILRAVQLSGIFNDSKTFVDMPMKEDPETINAAFESVNSNDVTQLSAFLDEYFYPVGSDLNAWLPPDLQTEPAFLSRITDPGLRSWAAELNELWGVLGREVNASVAQNPQRHSFLPRQYPMIVPGGRFRESYYWDSWWIVRGLLVCDMTTTAEYVIRNLLDDIENFGFIPNGGRIYYLDRSQPPLLSEMVNSYIAALGIGSLNATNMLETAFPLLQREYDWWMNATFGHVVEVRGNDGAIHRLNRYYSPAVLPRPESYTEDIETAQTSNRNASDLFGDIRAAAESGWDFSSRWFEGSSPKNDVGKVAAKDILPVELNTIMYRWELNMVRFAADLGMSPGLVNYYTEAANNRSLAIDAILWQSEDIDDRAGLWYDFNLTTAQSQKRNPESALSISQWVPMWGGLAAGKDIEHMLSVLYKSELLQDAGVLTTLAENTGQQWDSPNAWAPLVMFTIEGLIRTGIPGGAYLAQNISVNWLRTNYLAFNRTGFMYEKYNAYIVGQGGDGGEYVPQVGFGWTNGVALELLNSTLTAPPGQSGSDGDERISILTITMLAICGTLVFCGLLFFISFRCFKIFSPNKKIPNIFNNIFGSKRSRSRLASVNSGTKDRPSNEIIGRSGRSGQTNDLDSTGMPDALLARMTERSDDMSDGYSAAYF